MGAYNIDYILGACGLVVGLNGIATSMHTQIQFPEGSIVNNLTQEFISDYGMHQWINGFIYGLSLTLMVGSFCLGVSSRSGKAA
jgi:hypothetical protein